MYEIGQLSKNTHRFSQMQECFTYLKHFSDAICDTAGHLRLR